MSELAADLRPVVGIHQPNFFPWLGYFHKLRWSDIFVLLDDAQIQKTGGSFTNRTALAANGKQLSFTAPIDRTRSGTLRIDEVAFAPREDFRPRLVALLGQAYARAPFMKELGPAIYEMVKAPASSVGAFNSSAIRRITEMLGLSTKIVASSTLAVGTTSTQRLVDILEKVGGRTYLAGGGAKNYQEDGLFFARGMNVYYQEFMPPTYPRGREEPTPGLSVLDALLYLGTDGTRALLDAPVPVSGLKRARSETDTSGSGGSEP